MNTPKITNKQQEILRLLYIHRFLNRTQIQTLLGHTEKMRTVTWLRDLRGKQYAEWIYSSDLAEKNKPAIYYLGINGVRFLKNANKYPISEVRKRYKEALRKRPFIDRCLLIADCCITLRNRSVGNIAYVAILQASYVDHASAYHFLVELEPHLCFVKQEDTPEGIVTKNYLLDIFDATLPRYRVKHRLKAYEEYLEYDEWQRKTKDMMAPTVLLVCPTKAELIYAKRYTRKLLEYVPNRKSISMKFATIDELRQYGVLGEIWEKA
jgi:hypothetical protein